MRRPALALLLAVAAVLPAAPAAAQGIRSPHLWATVNVCDTLKNPNAIGIRASMPGAPNAREQMYMRFRVQYRRSDDGLWHNIANGANSGFMRVGSAKYKARQAGTIFQFNPPAGGRYFLRGKVTFQWRLGGKVRRSAALVTTAGHRSAAGSDPPGYSAATCIIS